MSSDSESPKYAPRGFPARVVQTVDYRNKVVINRGAADGIKLGGRYLIYAISSEDIVDPETGESLGRLELVRGKGVVTHIQARIATLEPEMIKGSRRVVRRQGGIFGLGDEEVIEPDERRGDFDSPEIGDLVKPI